MGMPGIDAKITSEDRQIWWGIREQQIFAGAVLASTTIDVGNSGITGQLRAGLILGRITTGSAAGKWTHYAIGGNSAGGGSAVPSAAGVNVAAGVLEFGFPMANLAGTAVDHAVPILIGGRLKSNQLLGLDAPSRRVLGASRFIFDDDVLNLPSFGGGLWLREAPIAGNTTIFAHDNGTLFVTSAAATFTLPAVAPDLQFGFFNEVDGDIVIDVAGSDKIVGDHSLIGVKLTANTGSHKIGAGCVVSANAAGTRWRVRQAGAVAAGQFIMS